MLDLKQGNICHGKNVISNEEKNVPQKNYVQKNPKIFTSFGRSKHNLVFTPPFSTVNPPKAKVAYF